MSKFKERQKRRAQAKFEQGLPFHSTRAGKELAKQQENPTGGFKGFVNAVKTIASGKMLRHPKQGAK